MSIYPPVGIIICPISYQQLSLIMNMKELAAKLLEVKNSNLVLKIMFLKTILLRRFLFNSVTMTLKE